MSLIYPKNVRAVEEMLNSFMPFAKERLGYSESPDIRLAKDPDNAQDPLGKTAYYEPQHKRITVYIDNRHVKDIMRSISHEMVHHAQNLRGDLAGSAGVGEQGYAQNDEHLREMEREAYEQGNLCFRDWEDGIKSGGLYEAFDRGDLISMIRDYSRDLTGYRDEYGDMEKLDKMSDEELQAYYQGMSDSPEAQDMERRFRDEEEAEMGTDTDFDRMPKRTGMSRGLRETNMFNIRRRKLNKRLMESFGYKTQMSESADSLPEWMYDYVVYYSDGNPTDEGYDAVGAEWAQFEAAAHEALEQLLGEDGAEQYLSEDPELYLLFQSVQETGRSFEDGEMDHLELPISLEELLRGLQHALGNFIDHTGGGSLNDAIRNATEGGEEDMYESDSRYFGSGSSEENPHLSEMQAMKDKLGILANDLIDKLGGSTEIQDAQSYLDDAARAINGAMESIRFSLEKQGLSESGPKLSPTKMALAFMKESGQHRPFQIGDYVRITDGGLRGAAGKIIELVELVTGEDGFVVLLDNPADKRVFGQAGDEVIVAADKVEPPVSAMQENMGASPTQMAMAFMNSRGYNTANIDVLELVAHLRAAGAKTQEDVQTAVIDFLQQNDISVQEEMSKRDFVNQAWEKAGATSRHVSDEEAGAVESFNNWLEADPMRQGEWEPAQSYRNGRVLAYNRKEKKYYDVQADMFVDDAEMDAILPESVKFQNVLKTKLQTIFKKHPHLAENKEFINKLKIGLKTTLTEKYKNEK